jgi:peptidoglycan DL-endopeptidase CwlO
VASPQHLPFASTSTRGPLSRLPARTLFVVCTGLLVVALLPRSAYADPALTAAGAQSQQTQAQSQLDALSDKAEVLVEQFDAAQDKLTTAQHDLAADRAAIMVAQQALDSAQVRVDAMATAAYESGGLDGVESVLTATNPELALQGADTIERLAASQGRDLDVAKAARNRLTQTQASAAQATAGVQALQASLKAQQKAIDALVGKQQAVLKAADAAAAAAAARATSATRSSRTLSREALPAVITHKATPAAPAAVPAVVPASADGRAAAALRFAYAQLGKPYRYGAAGARTFDCSGLTMRACRRLVGT